ncbi:hypothetical protein DSUL_20477 [Desulfovibrionales bacterium]
MEEFSTNAGWDTGQLIFYGHYSVTGCNCDTVHYFSLFIWYIISKAVEKLRFGRLMICTARLY